MAIPRLSPGWLEVDLNQKKSKGYSTAIPRLFHGYPTAIPRLSHGYPMVVVEHTWNIDFDPSRTISVQGW